MIVKMLLTFDYNPETNEYTPIKSEVVKTPKTAKVTEAKKAEESVEPQISLESNRYVLNKSAVELIGVQWEDRLDVKYQKVDKVTYPIIGTDVAWKTKSGNKLTKGLTVSCRGNANEVLSTYGDTFTVTPWKGHENLFVLVGNKDRMEEDENIKIKEDENPREDLPLDTTLDDEGVYKIDDLTFEI